MKRLLLLLIIVLLVGFGWLAMTSMPAPVQPVERNVPAEQVLGG